MQGSEQADLSWGFNCEWAKKRIANCADQDSVGIYAFSPVPYSLFPAHASKFTESNRIRICLVLLKFIKNFLVY